MAQLIPKPAAPVRLFEDNEQPAGTNHERRATISAVAVFSDGRRMVTGSFDKVVRLWDMKEGVVLKTLEGHSNSVDALAVSRDGQLIASGDSGGGLIAWDPDIGESLTQAIKAHSNISSLDFSPDGSMLATCSFDKMTKLWSTKTWELLGNPITCSTRASCVRFSPSGELIAIATEDNIQIYNPGTRGCVANFKGHTSWNHSLAWKPDGTRLFSAGLGADSTIREWDPSTWHQVGDPWKGHFQSISAISLNSDGTLLASASNDNRVRLWRVSDRRTIVVFNHSAAVACVTFSADDRHVISGGENKNISEWLVSENASPESMPKDGSKDGSSDSPKEQMTHQAQAYSDFKVLAINPDARNACIAGDLISAEQVLDREIDTNPNNHTSYANRALVMARGHDWDRALHDAIQSINIQPSLAGHISKSIVLCGMLHVQAGRISFDLASTFTNGDLKVEHFLFLIKAIALFNANEHKEAMLRIGELAASPNVDLVACRVVEAYLRVHLGMMALHNTRHSEAVDHFTAAANASASFHKSPIHLTYDEFVVLFGWDLKSLWKTANQQRCLALFRAGSFGAAIESYQFIMDNVDEDMKPGLRAWFAALRLE